jgi:predicted nucleic acid-binding protein
MNAVDTNILIYCHDMRDLHKQNVSQHLLETIDPMVLLWQVGCEFISAARKIEPYGFTKDDAWDALADMCVLAQKIALPVPEIWHSSRILQDRYGLHYWDSLIIGSCLHEGIKNFYTEDFGNHRQIENINIINPF